MKSRYFLTALPIIFFSLFTSVPVFAGEFIRQLLWHNDCIYVVSNTVKGIHRACNNNTHFQPVAGLPEERFPLSLRSAGKSGLWLTTTKGVYSNKSADGLWEQALFPDDIMDLLFAKNTQADAITPWLISKRSIYGRLTRPLTITKTVLASKITV